MPRKPFLKRRIIPTPSRTFNNNNGNGGGDENKPLDLHMRHAIMSANNLYEMSLNLTIPDYNAINKVAPPATRKAALVQDLNKTATETTNAIKGAATNFASRMYQFLTLDHDNNAQLHLKDRLKDVKLEDLLKFMMGDYEIWSDFREHLRQSKVITTMGVNEVMHEYIRERRDLLQWKYYLHLEKQRKEEEAAKASDVKPSVSATALNALTSAFRRASSTPVVSTTGAGAAGQGVGRNEEWVIPAAGASSAGAANGVAAVFQNILRPNRNEGEGGDGRRASLEGRFGLRRNRCKDIESKSETTTDTGTTTPVTRLDNEAQLSTEEKKEASDFRLEFQRRSASQATAMPILREASFSSASNLSDSTRSINSSSRSIGSSSTAKDYYGLLRPGDIVPEPPAATPPGSSGRLSQMAMPVPPDRSHRTLRGRSIASAPHLSQLGAMKKAPTSHANASFPTATPAAMTPPMELSVTAVTSQITDVSSTNGTPSSIAPTNQLVTTTPPAIVPPGTATPLDIFASPSVAGKKLKLAPHLANAANATRLNPTTRRHPLPTKPLGVASLTNQLRDRRRNMAEMFLPGSQSKSAKMELVTEMLMTNGRRRRGSNEHRTKSLPSATPSPATLAVVDDIERRPTAPPALTAVATALTAPPIPRPLSRPSLAQPAALSTAKRRVASAVTNRRFHHLKRRSRQSEPRERGVHDSIDDYLFNKNVREMMTKREVPGRRHSNDSDDRSRATTKGMPRVQSEPSLCSLDAREEGGEGGQPGVRDAESVVTSGSDRRLLPRRSSMDQLLLSAKDVVDGVLGGFTLEE